MEGTENYRESSINVISVDSTNINCVISTITASESDKAFDAISRDYFITKDQKVNIQIQENVAIKYITISLYYLLVFGYCIYEYNNKYTKFL